MEDRHSRKHLFCHYWPEEIVRNAESDPAIIVPNGMYIHFDLEEYRVLEDNEAPVHDIVEFRIHADGLSPFKDSRQLL